MKMKNLVISLVFVLSFTMSYGVNTFWDLARTTSTNTVQVKYFDKSTKQGGGMFIWIPTSTVGVSEVTGFRIFVTGKTNGYWERLESPMNYNPSWCGARNDGTYATLTSLGMLQATATTYWGYDYDGVTPLVDVTTMSYDEAAIQYMLRNAERMGFHKMNFEPKKYYLRRAQLRLPRVYDYAIGDIESRFMIHGNGASIFMTTTSGSRSAFVGYPVNQADCDGTNQVHGGRLNLQTRRFLIDNLSFFGAGGSSSDTAIFIGCSYGDVISNCYFGSFAVGVRSEFALLSTITGTKFHNCSYAGFIYQRGTWSGVLTANANSHKFKVENSRNNAGTGMWAAGIMKGSSGGEVSHFILEGGKAKYGFFYDDEWASAGVGTVRDVLFSGIHLETSMDSAAFHVRLATGQAIIERVHVDDSFWTYSGGGSKTFAQALNVCCQSTIIVRNCSNLKTPNLFFANRGSTQVWKFIDNKGVQNNALTNADWINNGYYTTPVFNNGNPNLNRVEEEYTLLN